MIPEPYRLSSEESARIDTTYQMVVNGEITRICRHRHCPCGAPVINLPGHKSLQEKIVNLPVIDG
jgi:hypothetical protein